jgi:hypothetical protein
MVSCFLLEKVDTNVEKRLRKYSLLARNLVMLDLLQTTTIPLAMGCTAVIFIIIIIIIMF